MRVSVSIGGLDPTGGAGILADAKTAWHHEFHAAGIVTALTAQGDKGVTWWEPVAPAHVVEQLEAVLFGSPVAAVKVGMVGNAGLVEPLVRTLKRSTQVPLVYDPVLAASTGERLYGEDLASLMPLLRLATLVTPNIAEVEELTGLTVESVAGAHAAAKALREAGAKAVLIKGGHLSGPPIDVLYDGIQFYEFTGERIEVMNVRGTGCALSTAIACRLGLGAQLPEAVSAAKAYLAERMRHTYHMGGRNRYLP
ncbi:MAG: bifunctional hydroxymethylpyrimidine kinase/phosphomethylpyrimidine kinase [bacterium]